MKKLNTLILSAIALVAILTFTQCSDAKDAVVTKILEVQAKAVNSQCPITLNNMMRMDSCVVLPSKTLKSYFTITSGASLFNPKTFEANSKTQLVQAIQANEELKKAREFEVVFIYVYNDPDGKKLGEITITAEDYNKPADELDKTILSDNLTTNDIEQMLEKEVEALQPQLPATISPGMILTECQQAGKSLVYTYKMTEVNVKGFDSTAFKAANTPLIRKNLANTPQVKKGLDAGVTYSYVYRDKDNKYLCLISINKDN